VDKTNAKKTSKTRNKNESGKPAVLIAADMMFGVCGGGQIGSDSRLPSSSVNDRQVEELQSSG